MNIFVLHQNPKKAAKMACDRHCVKMILESCQMLCTVANKAGQTTPYRSTHPRHPCTIWASSRTNWLWLYEYALALCAEYTHRYSKTHKCEGVIRSLSTPDIDDEGLTPFAQAVPATYKDDDVVTAYRNYYRYGKSYMNKGIGPQWLKDPARKPDWFESPLSSRLSN